MEHTEEENDISLYNALHDEPLEETPEEIIRIIRLLDQFNRKSDVDTKKD